MSVIAVIPARGGSKGIPNKNIIDFCGKPLVAWSIMQALGTKEISSVYVSSDSDEILAVSKSYGALGIKRPDSISGDTASSESAIVHILQTITEKPDLIVFLQPTSPLRKNGDISKAISQFKTEQLDSIFSGARLDDFLIWKKSSDGTLKSLNYDCNNRGRRQDREPQYVENGSFYIFKPGIITQGNRLGGKIGVYLMDLWQNFEIDDYQDLELVKLFFETKLKKESKHF